MRLQMDHLPVRAAHVADDVAVSVRGTALRQGVHHAAEGDGRRHLQPMVSAGRGAMGKVSSYGGGFRSRNRCGTWIAGASGRAVDLLTRVDETLAATLPLR